MKIIIQLQYSLTDSRVFMALKISRSQVSTQPNPPKIKKTLTQPNPWMDPTHDQLCSAPLMRYRAEFGRSTSVRRRSTGKNRPVAIAEQARIDSDLRLPSSGP